MKGQECAFQGGETMTDTTKTFAISDSFIRRLRLSQALVCGTLMIGMPALLLFRVEFEEFAAADTASLAFVLFFVAVVVTASALTTRYWTRRLRQTRLMISPDCIVREIGAKRQTIDWSSVTKARVYRTSGGKTKVVRIYTEGRKGLDLAGYDSMAEVADAVAWALAPSDRIDIVRRPVDMENPMVRAAMVGGCIVLGAGLGARMLDVLPIDPKLFQAFTHIGIGCIFFFSRSLSRQNPELRGVEVGLLTFYVAIAGLLFL
jgi:hypothetical protein